MNIFLPIVAVVVITLGAIFGGGINLGTPSQVQTSDTINTLRTTVNELVTNYVASSSIPGATTILGSTYIGVSTSNGTSTITNNGVQTLTAGTGIGVSSATGTPTITNTGVQSVTAGSNITVTSATGTPTFAVTSTPSFTSITYGDSIGQLYGVKPLCHWAASFASSTSSWNDDMCIIDSTSTITAVWVKQQSNGDTVKWNLYYGSNMPATTSTGAFPVFSSDQTTISTTTASLSVTASSTPNKGNFIRLYSYNASSTLFTISIWGKDR